MDDRVFPPSVEMSKRSHVKSLEQHRALSEQARTDPDAYWGARGREELHWETPFHTVLEWKPPHARWYLGGRTNLAFNCLDRHLPKRAAQAALLCEAEAGEVRHISYQELSERVGRLGNVLRRLGVKAGDRVGVYLPLGAEAAIAMLACARIGAVHSVIFGGFSAEALRERLRDARAKVLITADGGARKGAIVPLLKNAREAVSGLSDLKHVLVFPLLGAIQPQALEQDAAQLCAAESVDCPIAWVESDHPLFILYTSGSTGKPKGVLHATGGYSVNASLTTRWVFDLHDGDIYWCTADVGWVTGHTYTVYGPLLNGVTTLLYEGAPTYPAADRFWDVIARHRVTQLYTAPTAIRALMRLGDALPAKHDLTSLRLLGSVGEPINPQAWMWYRDVIGGGRCPVVDTWWQTETGSILIAPLPGAVPTKPGSATLPLPGVEPLILDTKGKTVAQGESGLLYLVRPVPSMLSTLFENDARYVQTYFPDSPEHYFTGDGARQDSDGYYWLMGRVDDVVNVAGHRLGTAEIESALVAQGQVAEAAVVGRPDDLKGTALVAFVTLKTGVAATPAMRQALTAFVGKEIGPIARPDEIRFADALPKTRSGKIMRRLLRDVAQGKAASGDTSTLEDLSVLARLSGPED